MQPINQQRARASRQDSLEMVVPEAQAGQRLDRFVAEGSPELSRAHVQKLIESGAITVDGKAAKPATRLSAGAVVRVAIPPAKPSTLAAEPIPLVVVYEDDDLLVIDKPPGLVVHPAPGHPTGTLVNALLARYPNLMISDTLRPGIVHRLDKDTSGLMVVAKNDRAFASLVEQMKKGLVVKEYLALVKGQFGIKKGIIQGPIGRDPRNRKMMAVVPGGKPASTYYEVLAELDGYTLVRARLHTGRTHQIRVHFASVGHPVVGDSVYGPGKSGLPISRQFLHAHRLSFKLPSSGREVEFESPLPADLQRVLDVLGGLQHVDEVVQ
ncbi:MAG: RluA family pseudouridine synthase [Chloroflexi bacterium]|nr:RluA family pseudouridine synthase [Chloroflexota bacterium]